MHRAITAIYPTYPGASEVRHGLERLGISSSRIHLIPELEEVVDARGHRDLDAHNHHLHDLHLPEEDIRTYQQAVRNGDYVVSVEVNDTDDIHRVKEIMRHPGEARDLDALDRTYAAAEYVPYSSGDRTLYPADQRRIRDPSRPGEPSDLRGYSQRPPR